MKNILITLFLAVFSISANAEPIQYIVNGTLNNISGSDFYNLDGASFHYVVTGDTDTVSTDWISSIRRTGYILPVAITFSNRPSGFSDVTIEGDRRVYLQRETTFDYMRFNVSPTPFAFGDGDFQFGGFYLYFPLGFFTEFPTPLPGQFDQDDLTSANFIPNTGGNGNLYELTITNIPGGVSPVPIDTDADGAIDDIDNCTDVANPGQEDTDGDLIGNRCDGDFNNDCVVNFSDIGLFPSEFLGTNPLFDHDASGSVSFLDYAILINYFTLPPGPSAAGCN